MKKRVAINGFGRIGRATAKIILDRYSDTIELIAINDLSAPSTLAHLLKYDTVYGEYQREISFSDKGLLVDGKEILVLSERDPKELPWQELKVDVVLECTGVFRDYEGARGHILAGAKRVVISAPSKDPDKIPSYLIGVNEKEIGDEEIIDIGSCTTNCLAPILKILDDSFGVERGFITTIHSYTSDQNLIDASHSDLRRARAAAENMVPTTTGAAKAIGRVIPKLEGKIDGMAVRVPTPAVSILDLFCELKKEVTLDEVKAEFKTTEVIKLEERPLVSSDFKGSEFSAVVDSQFLMVNGNLIKVIAWYDNEWGYSCRLADTINLL